jgi:hypothetical protein
MWGGLSKFIYRKRRRFRCSLVRSYKQISSASVDELWQKVVDLADVSWHPLLARTNVPYGLVPKPGLIFQAVTRLGPNSNPDFCRARTAKGVAECKDYGNSRRGRKNYLPG